MRLRAPFTALIPLVWALEGCAAARVSQWQEPSMSKEALRAISAGLPVDVLRRVLDAAPFRYRLVTVGSAGLTFWGPEGGRAWRLFEAEVAGLRFFPDGRRALAWSAGPEATLGVWDLGTEKPLGELRHSVVHGEIFPGGDRVLACGKLQCSIWRDDLSEELLAFGKPRRWRVDLFPCGRRLLLRGSFLAFSVLDAGTAQEVCSSGGERVWERLSAEDVVSFLPKGGFVTAAPRSRRVLVWSARCERLFELSEPRELTDVSILGDVVATNWVSGSDSLAGVTMWSAETGQKLRELAYPGGLRVVPFLWPECCLASWDLQGVVLWNLTSGEILQRFAVGDDLDDVAGCADTVAMLNEGNLSLFDVASGAMLRTLNATGAFHLALVLGTALDPLGIGRGTSWRDLPKRGVEEGLAGGVRRQ